MKRYIQLWIWGFMLSISLYTNNACAGDPQTLMNHWTVFKDTYTDYNVIHPLDPFWVEKMAVKRKIILSRTIRTIIIFRPVW